MAGFIDPRLHDPGFTPGRAQIPKLVALLTAIDRDAVRPLERVLSRAGLAAAEAAVEAMGQADESGRARLLALIARVAAETSDLRLLSPLLEGMKSPSLRCRRLAASGLGKLGDARAEKALLESLRDADPSLARVVVEALGKLGGAESLRELEAFSASDGELLRRLSRSRTLLKRRLSRSSPASISLDRALGRSAHIAAFCRAGLGPLLLEEIAALEPRAVDGLRVDFEHTGSLRELFIASRIALCFGVVVPVPQGPEPYAARVSTALAAPATIGWLSAWTDGPLKCRLEFVGGGHQRELAWSIADALAQSGSPLQNDPRDAAWTARLGAHDVSEVVLVPRGLEDPRFSYRKREVRAASHPTLAAALARIGSVREDDVVWDPFVGSGLELMERALLGPYRRLLGSDLDPAALDAARENLVGIDRVELVEGDALDLTPKGVTLILSNPPMGRRVARDGSIRTLLERFTARAAQVLEPGGRMAWLSALPRVTARAAERAGLRIELGPELDVGGFFAQVQVFRR